MKKLLLQLAFLLLPFLVFAQSEAPVIKNFYKKGREIITSFKLNDHVWVLQTRQEKEKSELVAIDDKMQVLWRTSVDGYSLGSGKYKNHVLAISAAKFHRDRQSIIGPYTAFLIDEKTGELLQQNIIFDSKSETVEFPHLNFTEDGSNFSLVIRQSDQGIVMFGYATKLKTIKSISVVKVDDTLNPTISSLKFPDGDFVNLAGNNSGDLFLFTHEKDDKSIKATRYQAPKFEAGESITQDMNPYKGSDLNERLGGTVASISNRNVVYFALTLRNSDKERELAVCKFNFSNHTAKTATEMFDKNHIKEIEKDYVPFGPDLDKPDLAANDGLSAKVMTEWNGTLVITLSNAGLYQGYSGPANNSHNPAINSGFGNGYTPSNAEENSILINGYDLDLKPKFQQIIPCWYRLGGGLPLLSMAYHGDKGSLCVLANTSAGGFKLVGLYGKLDLATGKWIKLEKLPKGDDIEKRTPMDNDVMWFDNKFIVPYQAMSTFGTDVSLQLNNY